MYRTLFTGTLYVKQCWNYFSNLLPLLSILFIQIHLVTQG